jgi:hypothetical protein
MLSDKASDPSPDLRGFGEFPLGPKAPLPIEETNATEECCSKVSILFNRIVSAVAKKPCAHLSSSLLITLRSQ